MPMQLNKIFLLACSLVVLSTLIGACSPEKPEGKPVGIDFGPIMIGCMASCEVSDGRTFSCSASGPGASCTTTAPKVVTCTEAGGATTTCNCAGNPPGCR